MADLPQTSSPATAETRSRMPRVEAALQMPLLSAVIGILAAAALGYILPPAFALPAAVAVMGLASLLAIVALDAHRKRELDAVSRNVGELNVRLGATRIKLDALRSRLDSEPLREADIEPTRSSLSELTAEVGLLGGVLRDVANAVSEHEAKLIKAEAVSARAELANPREKAKTQRVASSVVMTDDHALVAEPAQLVDAGLKRRDEARLAVILSAFQAGGLEVHLQPIVALPQRKTVGYEALARLRLPDGSLLMPAEFIAGLERSEQGANLDAQVLTQVLAISGHINAKAQDQFISLNLSAGTWAEARALGSIARAMEAFRLQATRIVIEIPQRTWRSLDPSRLGIIGGMAANGVRFAIDQVSDLRFDPAALSDRGVCFIKTPAALLASLNEPTSSLDIAATDFAQLLRRAGIELIGERAETDRLVADLIDLDIRLAQGFAISQPRPIKPEVFQSQSQRADAADTMQAAQRHAEALVDNLPLGTGTLAQKPPEAERIPFRAVLRRA